jgi:Na+/melibiose symporter-like transporter
VRFGQWRPVFVLAASLLLVLLAVVLLSVREGNHNEPLQGTALGSTAWGFFIVVAILITAGLLLLWFRQRTKR